MNRETQAITILTTGIGIGIVSRLTERYVLGTPHIERPFDPSDFGDIVVAVCIALATFWPLVPQRKR